MKFLILLSVSFAVAYGNSWRHGEICEESNF